MRILTATLLLSATALAAPAWAQNYVPAGNYNNPDVIVNMDVLGATPGLQPAPVYQQPLMRPRSLPPVHLTPPPAPSAPMPLAMPTPRPSPVAPPRQIASTPAAMPSPILDVPDRIEPAAATPKSEPAPFIEKDEMMAGPAPAAHPAPFMARDLAMMAPPAPAGSNKIDERKTTINTDKKHVKEIKPIEDFAETPVSTVAPVAEKSPAPVLTPMPKDAPIKPDVDKSARTLLAQAREKAESDDSTKREVVVLDKVATPQKNLTAPAAAMPQPLPAPAISDLDEPSTETKTAMLKPTPMPSVSEADQSAMKGAATRVDDFEAYRLLFFANSAEIKPSEQAVLNNIVGKMKSDPDLRLQMRSYAYGTPDTTAQARRMSLTRALNVRTYLVKQGIAATRLDVRALGMGSLAMNDQVGKDNIPSDRVDLIFVR